MISIPTLIRYMMYVAMAVIFSKLFHRFEVFNPTFFISCGILGEVLGWKYDNIEENK